MLEDESEQALRLPHLAAGKARMKKCWVVQHESATLTQTLFRQSEEGLESEGR
jgi:hypothetical protein